MKNNGGPAFPMTGGEFEGKQGRIYSAEGMSLRDYFAAKAMGGMIVTDNPDRPLDNQKRTMAIKSYQIADAMLKAREE